jgi:hypothetical protein
MLVKYSQSVCAQALDSNGAALAPLGRIAHRQGKLGAGLRRGWRGEKKLMKQRAVPPLIFCLAAVLALAAGVPVRAHAQTTPPWTGIIAPSRAIDWSHAGLPATLPDGETTANTYTPPLRTTICASIAPEGSSSAPVAPTDVNAAIASCPAGEVVYLQPGSFYFSSGIDFNAKSDVTLRGAGADQTLLYFFGAASCVGRFATVCVNGGSVDTNWAGNPGNTASWTAGYAAGTTQITLSNTANITPGKTLLTLDQGADANFDNGAVWDCATAGICSDEGLPFGMRAGKGQFQVVLATAVSGSTVTISPGLYMANWSASRSPGAWWGNNTTNGDGLEDLSIDTSATSAANAGILLEDGYGCWVVGVRVVNTVRNHVWIINSAHDLVANSYFYGTQNSAEESYGVETAGDSDDLVVNNIFQHIVAGIMQGATVGTVWAYNLGFDDYFAPSTYTMMADAEPHDAGSSFDLFEGNAMNAFNADDIHGAFSLQTAFRDELFGADLLAPGSQPNTQRSYDAFAIMDTAFHRYFNIVGNVLGYPGFTTTYEVDEGSPGNNYGQGIYSVGGSGVTDFAVTDPVTNQSLLRWGNYDVVHGATQWNPSEVPSGLDETPGYQQALTGSGDGPYTATLTNCSAFSPAVAGGVTVDANGEEQGYDNGSGVLESSILNLDGSTGLGGTALSSGFIFSAGTVSYTGCTVSVMFTATPSNPTVQYLATTTTASPFQNPLPAAETLPASFFLSSKPSWWDTAFGTPPWPAIGPDVTGGPGPGGHAYAIPAELCYENTPNDSSYPQDASGLYVKLFNAGKCYGQPPAAPTGLTAAVQ